MAGSDGSVGVAWSDPAMAAALPLPPRELGALAKAMLAEARRIRPSAPASAEVALLTDGDMAALNLRALGCPGPTNVLSFPGEEAEIALAPETVARESLLYGQDPAEHLVRLLAHGLAHSCGLDHGPELDAVQEALEAAGAAFLRRRG